MTNYKNEMIQEFPYLEERFINNNSGFDIEQFFTECVLNINKEIRSEKIKDMPKCAKYFLELRFNRSSLNPEYIP